MELQTTYKEFADEVLKYAKDSSAVYIASFSLYAGITAHEGVVMKSPVADLLNGLKEVDADVHIVVGRPDFMECTKGCQACKKKYAAWLIRYNKHKKEWPGFNWKLHFASHAKFVAFKPTNHCIVGGRNLSESGLFDINITVQDEELADRLIWEFEGLTKQKGPIMTMGKYRGRPVEQLPDSYLEWMLLQADWKGSPEILKAAKDECKKRGLE